MSDSRQKAWPKVTVVIVNWNGERFLERCLTALLAQTVTPYEFPRGFKFLGVQLGVYFLH